MAALLAALQPILAPLFKALFSELLKLWTAPDVVAAEVEPKLNNMGGFNDDEDSIRAGIINAAVAGGVRID